MSALFVIASVMLALETAPAHAQTCRWDGTAPFCDGECGDGEIEQTRNPDMVPASANITNSYGEGCWSGSKALCCASRNSACRWDGTAPFCDGECRAGEKQTTPPDGSSSGNPCVTGSKVYCCRNTGNAAAPPIRQRLEANPDLTKYAAFWEQRPGSAWVARHGLTAAQYQDEFNKLTAQGYRPIQVSGYSVGDTERYAAIWEKVAGPAWVARHGLTAAQYQDEFNKLTAQGYRPVDLSGYTVRGQDRYTAIFAKTAGVAWTARHGLTARQYQDEFDRLAAEGYRLVDISGYSVGGQDRYAAIWERREGPAWVARHGMTSQQYQQEFNKLSEQGYRLAGISGWRSGDTLHYAAIWEQTTGPAWVARHGLLSDSYQEEFDRLTKNGYRLRHISGYHIYD